MNPCTITWSYSKEDVYKEELPFIHISKTAERFQQGSHLCGDMWITSGETGGQQPPQISQLWRSWICCLKKIPFPGRVHFLSSKPKLIFFNSLLKSENTHKGRRLVMICKYIKAFQGLTSREWALPPVAPEVIHIQSYSWLLCLALWRALDPD